MFLDWLYCQLLYVIVFFVTLRLQANIVLRYEILRIRCEHWEDRDIAPVLRRSMGAKCCAGEEAEVLVWTVDDSGRQWTSVGTEIARVRLIHFDPHWSHEMMFKTFQDMCLFNMSYIMAFGHIKRISSTSLGCFVKFAKCCPDLWNN